MVAKKFWLSGSYMRPISLEGGNEPCKIDVGRFTNRLTA